jgi:predicted membrane protein
MITQLLAHAGEEHSDIAETVTHYAPWYIAVPIFFIIIALIGYLAWLVSGKKIDTVLFVEALLMLFTGFLVFNISPVVSVISITVGIVLAGFLAFVGIAGDTKK